MKLKAANKIHYDAGPNMTPLVDIVMVILIFLMLTGTFAVGEHFLQSNIPVARKGLGDAPPPPGHVPDEPLEVRVDSLIASGPDGAAVSAWRAVVGGGPAIQSDREELARRLVSLRMRLNAAGTPTDRIQVVLVPGLNTKYKHLVEAYQAALDAEFNKVAFSTAHK